MTAEDPLRNAAGQGDPLHIFRWLIGYGPESFRLIVPRFADVELAHLEAVPSLIDRAHNEIWDVFAMTGLLGLLASLLLFVSLFYLIFARLGLLRGRRRIILFFGVCAGGALLGGSSRERYGTSRSSGWAFPWAWPRHCSCTRAG